MDSAITSTRSQIDAFITSVLDETNRKIPRKAIWIVAGYRDATEFERFQRDAENTTKSAKAAFRRVLDMSPKRFIDLLDKK